MGEDWHLAPVSFRLTKKPVLPLTLRDRRELAAQRRGAGCSRQREQHAQGDTLRDGGNAPLLRQAFEDTWRWILLYPPEPPTTHSPAGRGPPALHLPEGLTPPAPPAHDFTVHPSPCGSSPEAHHKARM